MYKNKKYRSASTLHNTLSSISEIPSNATSNDSFIHPDENRPPLTKQKKPNEFPSEEIDSSGSESIPSSQTIPSSLRPSQARSQRSTLLGRSQFIHSMKRVPTSYYETVLLKCGVDLDQSNCIVLSVDHIKFVSSLRQVLKSSSDYPENVKRFLKGMQESIKNDSNLIKILSGCIIKIPNVEFFPQSQESLMKNFLMVEFLQTDLINILIEKMKVFVLHTDESSELSIFSLILSQLTFVDHYSNGNLLLTKIFEVLSLSSNDDSRQEIIGCLQDIIDPSRHNECIRKLMDLIENDEELLTATSVDTFGNMHLSTEIQTELKSKIIQYINKKIPISLFPPFIKFILTFNDDEKLILPDLISDLRLCLNWDFENVSKNTLNRTKLTIFESITRSLTRSKKLFDIWIKSIQNITMQNGHKPIDVVILIIMMSINDARCNYIENIFRRKIKTGLFTMKLMSETIQELSIIIVQYMKYYLQLIDHFVRDRDPIVSKLGYTGYKLIFSINCDKKPVISNLISFVYEKRIVTACGLTTIDLPTNTLYLLTEINKKYPIEMQSHGLQLLRIVDRICELNLLQFRLVMNLLCSLAYPLESSEVSELTGQLQENLDILIKKQITSSILEVKHRGIIGVTRVIDHIVWTATNVEINCSNESLQDKTFNSIDELPDGPGKKAAELTGLILTATSNCIVSLSLAFDELAGMFSNKYGFIKRLPFLDKDFLSWFCDMITSDFQKCFILSELPEEFKNEFSNQFCINTSIEQCTSDDEIEMITLNIGEKTITSNYSAISSINILPSLFNLLRVLHFRRYGGILDSINALLGCSIILPICMEEHKNDINIFDKFDKKKCKNIMDNYFYTINWMREIIGAFANQQDETIRKKVVCRLTQLIQLETTIRALLKAAPSDYMPPICQFVMNENNNLSKFKKPAVPKKPVKQKIIKPKPVPTVTNTEGRGDSEGMSILATMRTHNQTTGNISDYLLKRTGCSFTEVYGKKEIYRQIDPDIMFLLKEELKIEINIPNDQIGEYLGLLEFKFIIEDLVNKLESVTGIRKFVINQQVQFIISPSDLINDLIYFLPRIMDFIKQFSVYIKNRLDLSNDVRDNEQLFTDEINYTKVCLGLCLRLLAAMFTWPGFEDDVNQKMLKECLRIVGHQSELNSSNNVKELACLTLKNILTYKNVILDLKSAVHMFHLTKGIANIINEPDSFNDVTELCSNYLSKLWYSYEGTKESGAQCNVLLDELLKGLFKNVKFPMISNNVKSILKEVKVLNTKNGTLKKFPCFHKGNFPLLFRSLFGALVNSITVESETVLSAVTRIKSWEKACEILTGLLEIIKSLDLPRNFILFLKYSHIFLKIFLQYGMEIIEINLKTNAERVNELLRSLQQTTRFLHNLCCHSKAIKNTAIVAQIPFLRQTIELLGLRVKAALVLNKCSSVFWMGNLKNKDLHGDEIISQAPSLSQYTTDDGDDELPDDDDDSIEADLGIEQLNPSSQDTEVSASSSRSECF